MTGGLYLEIIRGGHYVSRDGQDSLYLKFLFPQEDWIISGHRSRFYS